MISNDVKKAILSNLTILGMFLSCLPAEADVPGNQFPAVVEAPNGSGGAEAALKRLEEGAGGKTPTVKTFTLDWVRGLAQRGEPKVYTGENSSNFDFIGMPVGGIGCGQLYIGGDGKLWHWDIFNERHNGKFQVEHGAAYAEPPLRDDRKDDRQHAIEQGFAIRITAPQGHRDLRLDRDGVKDIRFRGQYPIALVSYTDASMPVKAELEAMSPFIPRSADDSSYPATILSYTVLNTGKEEVKGKLAGWLENAVSVESRKRHELQFTNRVYRAGGLTVLECSAAGLDGQTPQKGVTPAKNEPDFGTMTLAVVEAGGEAYGRAAVDCGTLPSSALDASAKEPVKTAKDQLIGSVGREFALKPGEKTTIRFIVSWYFPNPMNLNVKRFANLATPSRRAYAMRFTSAGNVAENLAARLDELVKTTRLWRDTWYDSTLPWWFLDRTFLNTSALATATTLLLEDGRFYGMEGVYSCPGTCTHVWGYNQAVGCLFPEFEIRLREKVDFNRSVAFGADGAIGLRGEFQKLAAVDGQSGIIIRCLRIHQMSGDDAFLKRNWASIRKAMDYLVNTYDADRDGIMEGPQKNTLDAAWYGKIAWLSVYYQAALRATAVMADAMGEAEYANSLREIARRGRTYAETNLFNGEYFIQEPDPLHPESPGVYNGCEYSQLLGQSQAYQVGLGQILDPFKVTAALGSLWKYNFSTDVGPFREQFKPGRWYAMPGEGGLIGCTWPRGGMESLKKGNAFYAAYLNECQAGYEYACSSLMMWHGLVDKALAHAKTVHDRYDGSKRNPWNECECGSHYSRSMASYGLFTAVCGFECDGPSGKIAFLPRMTPDNFKSAFTAAGCWGTFRQTRQGDIQQEAVEVKWGQLRLRTLSFALPEGAKASRQNNLTIFCGFGTRRPCRMQPPFKGLNLGILPWPC